MLPVNKIYIDSRARTDDGQSTSNFVVDLKESFTMPEDAAFTIAGVNTAHLAYDNGKY